MVKVNNGFTLIEVAIFLAVTGLLFISVTVGVQNSIFQQRYTDSVQGFADFLRNMYSEVANVQSLSGGRSDLAIYGKLITFGERENLNAESTDGKTIFAYDVIGKAEELSLGTNGLFKVLKNLDSDVVIENTRPMGIVNEYRPRWSAAIQTTSDDNPPQEYVGTILVVRHPSSGRIYTAVMDGVAINVNNKINNVTGDNLNVLNEHLWNDEKSDFKIEEVNFCVNPNGDEPSTVRANVRIDKNASNASGVEVIMDGDDNKCNGGD